ncbi:MAG: hypothetical protein PT116_05165 [Aphanizomenon gracile PMC638.10]|nr:hypothetical protein [Aphanizomenon gracile PMC638.10]
MSVRWLGVWEVRSLFGDVEVRSLFGDVWGAIAFGGVKVRSLLGLGVRSLFRECWEVR